MRSQEFAHEGIIDHAVVFHPELNPLLWEGDRLKLTVRYKLLEIAKHFIEFIDLPQIQLRDITLSGSNAAYTYTNNSDIDLHLVVDIPYKLELFLKPLFDAKKNQYNFSHDVKIKGIDVEVYVQDRKDEHHSSGIYSVLDDKWLSEPKRQSANIEDQEVKEKVRNYLNKIKLALRSNDYEKAKPVMDELYKLRKAGLEQEGEFSVENIAFKVLRAKGWINKLREHLYDLEDIALSLENIE
jgi:hypothetical protein